MLVSRKLQMMPMKRPAHTEGAKPCANVPDNEVHSVSSEASFLAVTEVTKTFMVISAFSTPGWSSAISVLG